MRSCQRSGGCTEQPIQRPVHLSWAKRPVPLCRTIVRPPLPLFTPRQLILAPTLRLRVEPTPLVLHLMSGFLGERGISKSGLNVPSQVKTLRLVKLMLLTWDLCCRPQSRCGRRCGRARLFLRNLGARRRRTPRARADLKVPKDASHRDRSDATRRFDLALGVRRRHAPKKLLEIDPRSSRCGRRLD